MKHGVKKDYIKCWYKYGLDFIWSMKSGSGFSKNLDPGVLLHIYVLLDMNYK